MIEIMLLSAQIRARGVPELKQKRLPSISLVEKTIQPNTKAIDLILQQSRPKENLKTTEQNSSSTNIVN